MSLTQKDGIPKAPPVATGLAITLVVHAGLISGALLLGHREVAEAEPRIVNVLEAKLVRLGEELPKHMLPKLEAAPAPVRDDGVKLTRSEEVKNEPEPKEKPKKKENLEQKLEEQLFKNALNPRERGAGGTGRSQQGVARAQGGSRHGDPDGEALSARDAQEGDMWVMRVKRALQNALDVPSVIPQEAYAALSAIVELGFDETGRVTSWKLITPARGSHASLFNNAVEAVQRKVRSLPEPPAGALKKFKSRRLRLKMVPPQ